jgi:TolB-like protein/DNA-binding winged helix-turn-helix (wHTH) protein
MKSFKAFRLDTTNHILWRDGDRVPVAPKSFDVLAYLIENAGRVVTQDEMLEALWPQTYVNPEVLRKYILEVRRTLGDRPENPEFIETLPKRGYRFIAPVIDECAAEPRESGASHTTEESVGPATPSKQEPSSGKHLPWKLAITAALAAVLGASIATHYRSAASRPNVPSVSNTSIAVLPFTDMSPAKDQEYFSDGLAEQLINDLAKVSGLRVVGRSSAFHFRGVNEDLRDVGRKLGVANILEGNVRRQGNHVRITAELIKADDGFQLWSQTYDRQISDIFAVQDEIALAAAQALQVKLFGANGRLVASTPRSNNPEAYQAYLEATYFFGRGQNKEDLNKALMYTNMAIKLDDRYAPGWALRAAVTGSMAEVGIINIDEGFRNARKDAERAIALDSTLAAAYLVLARAQMNHDWDWDSARTSIAKTAELEPGNVELFRLRSYLARQSGDLDQAIKLYEEAVALDPLRVYAHLGLGFLLYVAGQYDKANAELKEAQDLNPQAGLLHLTFAKILLATKKPQQALAEIDKETVEWGKLTGQGLVYHALGRERESNAALAELIAKEGSQSAFQVAQVYAFRGENNKAFEWLERAFKQRDAGLPEMKTDPLLKGLRQDPRYTDLLRRLRLLK